MSAACAVHEPADGTCRRTTGRWPDGCNRYCGEPAGGVLGPGCEAELHAALGALPALWDEIGSDLSPGTTARGAYVSGGGSAPPLPINLQAQSLLDSISWWTRLYEEEVRLRAHLTEPAGRPRTAAAVRGSCSLLDVHLSVLLAIPDDTIVYDADRDTWVNTSGLDAAERLLHLYARARARLGQTRAKHRHPDVPCRACGVYAITRDDGQDVRGCEVCGEQYGAQDWETYLAWLEHYTEPLRRQQGLDRRLARR